MSHRPSALDPARPFIGAEWFDVLARRAALPRLPETLLLHAGPPFRGEPPAPVRHAAIQALLFEGLAQHPGEAWRLLSSGSVQLRPAQDHGIATPLAQVVSASMVLVAVRQGSHVGLAAMLEGTPPALRFGSSDPACRGRLRRLGGLLTDQVRPVLHDAPLPLADIIREAVAAGEDCHARTAVANRALLAHLRRAAKHGLDAGTADALAALPAFVLPLFMAAAVAALQHHGCAVDALGANGIDFGMRRRGASDWSREAAVPPTGERLAGREGCAALPAIGDSVLVDFCGLGGQVDDPAIHDALRDPDTGILDIARIGDTVPRFNLAILDAAGEVGLIGRGVYRPPATAFR